MLPTKFYVYWPFSSEEEAKMDFKEPITKTRNGTRNGTEQN